ncbi:Co2+/Mg2+ efflux protein ApaG [Xanthobacter tagetidis]|jgi:ApaG protein|uniref:Protein ApaG n=1 Tax=Xanthobacter tagetidis TaxID=60216 RepID=A0A3L7ANW4_9HYPH|nr:Co2+/Mg2+ efflux protein ApaG [Xanthobacter tagetidis]MBB6308039.1 ApaG protein [Xanthobacter tagetidis]RLP81675.1 Co2+/Mg2+ efflux protein ApaG [Xanthobacter tagetidis]
MYRATTRQIQVTATPRYVAERSEPDQGRYFWAYTIEVTNLGSEIVQLKARHWIITDANGRTEEVHGPGVVGEQPVLPPGGRFEYTSGVPLTTATGIMSGRYDMVTESGEAFSVEVPAFSLDMPDMRRVLN